MEVCFLNWFELNISSIFGKFPHQFSISFPPLLRPLTLTHSFTQSLTQILIHLYSIRNTQELYRHQVLKNSFGIFNQNTILCLCWSSGNQFKLISGGFDFNSSALFLLLQIYRLRFGIQQEFEAFLTEWGAHIDSLCHLNHIYALQACLTYLFKPGQNGFILPLVQVPLSCSPPCCWKDSPLGGEK